MPFWEKTASLPVLVAGTCDAIDTHLTDADGQEFTMIDTAGMRKSGKVYENTEKYSVMPCKLTVQMCSFDGAHAEEALYP